MAEHLPILSDCGQKSRSLTGAEKSRTIRRDLSKIKSRVRERNGGLGPEHEVDVDPNPSADNEGRAEGRRGVDAEAEGGVQGADHLHADEQVQGQRLVPDLRRQSRGHALDRQVLVRPQPPQVRVRPPVRYPRNLPLHRARARAPPTRRQDPEGCLFCFPIFPLLRSFFFR